MTSGRRTCRPKLVAAWGSCLMMRCGSGRRGTKGDAPSGVADWPAIQLSLGRSRARRTSGPRGWLWTLPPKSTELSGMFCARVKQRAGDELLEDVVQHGYQVRRHKADDGWG